LLNVTFLYPVHFAQLILRAKHNTG